MMMSEQKIINGDCIEIMRGMADNSIDFCVTDPPYFLTNNSGFGFMGKSWDSIKGLYKYLWESSTFVNSVIKFLSDLLLEDFTEEEKHVQKNVNILLSNKTKNLIREKLKNVLCVKNSLKLISVRKKDSADLLVLTKQEVWDLLKELCPSHTKIVDKFLGGVKKSALFVIPISLLKANARKNIVLKNVLPKLKAKDFEEKEILLSLTDQVVLKNAIDAMIGTKSEEESIKETDGLANIASSIVEENKFNVITLFHLKKEDLITWITSLLCAINAIRSSKTIQNYLIENFYKQIFKECFRVCKPGSMIAVFGGTRTFHRLTCAIEDSGFSVKDVCMFLYGQGFPKAMNFGKKLGKEWNGYSSCGLKPAYEPIIIAEKPIDKTYINNAEKWGVAGINIDECRIEAGLDLKSIFSGAKGEKQQQYGNGTIYGNSDKYQTIIHDKGRWPSNLILSEESAQALDEMTGVLKSGSLKPTSNPPFKGIYEHGRKKRNINQFEDSSGGASRFFYCAKASSSERNSGLEEMPLKDAHKIGKFNENPGRNINMGNTKSQNFHPTVKPIALMKYILKLLAPPGNPICLDPFSGSGSTLVAAKELGISCIGIEKEKEYCNIAEARIRAAVPEEPELF